MLSQPVQLCHSKSVLGYQNMNCIEIFSVESGLHHHRFKGPSTADMADAQRASMLLCTVMPEACMYAQHDQHIHSHCSHGQRA